MSDESTLSEQDDALGCRMEDWDRASREGDAKRANALAMEIMAEVMSRADDEPSPWLQLVTRAAAHEDQHEWIEAEACYKAAIMADSSLGAEQLWKVHDDMAGFYELMGRHDEALEHARLAEAATRDGRAMDIVRAMALCSRARFERQAGNWPTARGLADEAVELIGNDTRRSGSLARALTGRAECSIEVKDLALAMADLDAAWTILEASQDLAATFGNQNGQRAWWAVRARAFELQGDPASAIDASAKSVQCARVTSGAMQLKRSDRLSGLVSSLQRHERLLWRLGRAEDARVIDQECADLRVILYGPTGTPPVATD